MAEREGLEAPLRAAVRCGRSRGLACFAGKRSAFPQLRTFTGFESLTRCRKKPASKKNAGLVFTMAGYVRVSANTYAYGLRRGFALLVTGVTL